MAALLWILFQGCSTGEPEMVCSDPLGCVRVAPGEPLCFGILQALSGKVSALGIEQIRGIQLALRDRNGMVAGRPVELTTEDTGCSAEGGTNAALKILADPRTVAVIGTTCSTAGAAASREVSEAGLVMVSGNNSAPFLTSMNGEKAPRWQAGYFRTACNEESAGKAAALFAHNRLGIREAATVNDGDIYTTGLSEGFRNAFEALGGKVVLSATINKGDVDMAPVLEAVHFSRARLLFFPLFQPEGNRILLEARKTEAMDDLVLMSDGALIEAGFLASVGRAALGMYFVGPAVPDTMESRRLERDYEKRFGTPPMTAYYLSAYDAASLLFSAVERSVRTDTRGTLLLGRGDLRQALYQTRGYQGVTGILNCDRFGDCAAPRFSILRMDDPDKGLEGLLANRVYEYAPGAESFPR